VWEVEKMTRLSIQVSEDLKQAIRLPPEEVPVRLKKELAIRLYDKGLLAFGQARQLAGMTRWDFHDLLGEEGILRRYDVDELEEDLQTLETLE
jgi:predicted HTH domain antitoxin